MAAVAATTGRDAELRLAQIGGRSWLGFEYDRAFSAGPVVPGGGLQHFQRFVREAREDPDSYTMSEHNLAHASRRVATRPLVSAAALATLLAWSEARAEGAPGAASMCDDDAAMVAAGVALVGLGAIGTVAGGVVFVSAHRMEDPPLSIGAVAFCGFHSEECQAAFERERHLRRLAGSAISLGGLALSALGVPLLVLGAGSHSSAARGRPLTIGLSVRGGNATWRF